jgi:hypothetical protein
MTNKDFITAITNTKLADSFVTYLGTKAEVILSSPFINQIGYYLSFLASKNIGIACDFNCYIVYYLFDGQETELLKNKKARENLLNLAKDDGVLYTGIVKPSANDIFDGYKKAIIIALDMDNYSNKF